MALVSAHRGGAGDDHALQNTLAAYEAAIQAGCDFVEFDVRLTADGRPVLFHDDRLESGGRHRSISHHTFDDFAGGLVELDALLTLIAGRVGAHVDLKVRGGEIDIVASVIDALGVGNVIITTAEDSSVRTIQRWAHQHAPGLLVGLSSSARSHGRGLVPRWKAQIASGFPRLRIWLSGANLVVSHKLVARLSLKAYARRRGLQLVVWTVDGEDELSRWMNDPDVWMVTTNYPERAIAARR
ncbi:MAG: glycerophosphoryl diester phosphodiesterase [Nocardioidaceae bacterium]|nr:glycerophosphoryl diester phosphodiesterase [Nocardioidaceae bacterium]